MKRTLYNGIQLPAEWPPRPEETSLDRPFEVPYLKNPPSTVIIKTGRQLFVDDFLIEETDLHRVFHRPTQTEKPIFAPQTPLEMNGGYCPMACPFKDGIFYDDEAKKFMMWYHAGWFDGTSYAESDDGIHWRRVTEIRENHTGLIIPHKDTQLRDGAAVWIDYAADKSEKYKMFLYYREFEKPISYFHQIPDNRVVDEYGLLYASENGIDWVEKGRVGECGDNTTFFYNPFTKKWVFSIRYSSTLHRKMRIRGYYETEDFYRGSQWHKEDISFWGRTDEKDAADKRMEYAPQLYNLDATPYESLMLGMYSVFVGPPNEICEQVHQPKIIDLKLAFSRDGYHWDRPTYQPFLASSRVVGDWNYGYLHPANGLCLVVGDELYIYYSALSGQSPNFGRHMYAGGSVGLAKLRRDGFASMEDSGKGGTLLTRPLRFAGSWLFVNAAAQGGRIEAELLDAETGKALEGFSREACIPAAADKTLQRIGWRGNPDLSAYKDRAIQIRFFCQNAKLYAFWISPNENGASMGPMAGGGPGFQAGVDCL